LQCHSILLRQLYGEDITIVFIGPCIAKKVEADTTPGFPDFALTFRELRGWLAHEAISLDTLQRELSEGIRIIPELIPARAGETTLYPVEGGMIASLLMGKDVFQASSVAISGAGAVMATLDDLPVSSLLPDSPVVFSDFLELLTCEGGCINGPGVVERRSSAVRKSTSTRFTRSRLASARPVYLPDSVLVDRLLAEGYALLFRQGRLSVYPAATMVPGVRERRFSEEDIARALFELGKNDPSDELNCGGCGYNSCRDMAVAYLDGMAEPEMCVTKMRKQAQSKIDVLLRTLPMGVVIVDRELRIVDCNAEFLHVFGDIDYAVEGEIIDLISGLPLQRFVPFHQEFAQHFGETPATATYRLHYKEKFLQVAFFTVENHRLVGAIFQDITTPTVRRETVVKHAEAVIQKSLETVQQIASLLGENAAETEIMLNSLIEAFKVPSGHSTEGFLPDDDQRRLR
jgi:PAS domain-containing protein